MLRTAHRVRAQSVRALVGGARGLGGGIEHCRPSQLAPQQPNVKVRIGKVGDAIQQAVCASEQSLPAKGAVIVRSQLAQRVRIPEAGHKPVGHVFSATVPGCCTFAQPNFGVTSQTNPVVNVAFGAQILLVKVRCGHDFGGQILVQACVNVVVVGKDIQHSASHREEGVGVAGIRIVVRSTQQRFGGGVFPCAVNHAAQGYVVLSHHFWIDLRKFISQLKAIDWLILRPDMGEKGSMVCKVEWRVVVFPHHGVEAKHQTQPGVLRKGNNLGPLAHAQTKSWIHGLPRPCPVVTALIVHIVDDLISLRP
eukprot:m.176023 g.176023  ORF g.176023 m.176023 type:complete len:308 (-) comp21375_c0_seq2:76-999(-)